jgi:tripartite-type tricarboxylate transporter receptor subunit TctC
MGWAATDRRSCNQAICVATSSGSVPFGASGNTDSPARIYSARLSARLGQQFVIENRVGAGSIIGIMSLAAAPDGYTIGVGTSAGLNSLLLLADEVIE